MKRLIIREGERIIRHELGDAPVTLGRDPSCDLYFTDQRLSRRHCRVEATPDGVRFEDLGSRNGSYIGTKRVGVVILTLDESVRMGGLFLSYEDDTPPTEAGPDDSIEDATVILNTSAPEPNPEPEPQLQPEPHLQPEPQEDATVMLTAQPSEHTPRLLKKQPSAPSPPENDKTVILPAQPVEPAKAPPDAKPGLPKTRVLDVNALAADVEKGPSDTMLLTRDAKPPRPTPAMPVRSVETATPPPMPDEDAASTEHGWLASLSWSAKLLFLVASVAFVVYFVLAFPLVRTLGSALREESLRRGRALLSLTAAANGTAIGEGRIRDASVDNILREERVKEALLLDLDGNVLVPSSRADEVMTTIDGISAELSDIRTFYLGRRGSDYVMVEPLLHRSRRVGFAVVVYEAASASASWATAVLFLGFLVLLLGVVTALVFGKRMTLEPLSSFRDDVEAVVKGDADYVPPRQGFAELSELARSVNRLIARSFTARVTPSTPVLPGTPSPTPPLARETEARGPRIDSSGRNEAKQTTKSSPASPKRPITAAVRMSPDPDAAKFWVDENFIVVRADDEAAALVGAAATGMEGKHIIEAVADQKLLEVILDAVNALEELPAAETTAELPDGSKFHVSASKEQGSTVVGLRKL